jgi:hypothetical protein
LSGEELRLYEVTRSSIEEIPLAGLPLAPLTTMPRERRQLHAFVTNSAPRAGHAVFHGGGGEADVGNKPAIVRYFQRVDEALQQTLAPDHPPLILAGVGYIQALYRTVNTYPHLVGEGLTGAFIGMPDREIQARAWDLAEPMLQRPVTQAMARFDDLAGTGQTLTEIVAIAQAARDGRVDVVLGIWRSRDVAPRRRPPGDSPRRSR